MLSLRNLEELEKSMRSSHAASFEKARLVFLSKESIPESLDFSTLKRPRLASYRPSPTQDKQTIHVPFAPFPSSVESTVQSIFTNLCSRKN